MLNKVILMGRITANPELRQNQSGSVSCNFTLAIDGAKNATTGERQSDFIRCTAWNKTAEFMSQYVDKGAMLIVEGNLKSGQYQDRKYSDVTHYTMDVWVTNLSFGESKAAADLRRQQQGGGYNAAPAQSGGYQKENRQPQKPPQSNYQPDNSFGNLSDFEEVISESDLPF